MILLSDGVDWDTGGELGHRLKMSLKPRKRFLAYVPIHLQCPDPPRLMVLSCPNSPRVSRSTPVDDTIISQWIHFFKKSWLALFIANCKSKRLCPFSCPSIHPSHLWPQKLSCFSINFQKLHEVWKGFFNAVNLRATATFLLDLFRSYGSTKATIKLAQFGSWRKKTLLTCGHKNSAVF